MTTAIIIYITIGLIYGVFVYRYECKHGAKGVPLAILILSLCSVLWLPVIAFEGYQQIRIIIDRKRGPKQTEWRFK
jgi:hypothetical protein